MRIRFGDAQHHGRRQHNQFADAARSRNTGAAESPEIGPDLRHPHAEQPLHPFGRSVPGQRDRRDAGPKCYHAQPHHCFVAYFVKNGSQVPFFLQARVRNLDEGQRIGRAVGQANVLPGNGGSESAVAVHQGRFHEAERGSAAVQGIEGKYIATGQ